MHFFIGLAALLGVIAFAFGERTARTFAGTCLLLVAGFFAYIMYRIVTGTI